MPLLSIVIPVYNKADALPYCLQSLTDNALANVELVFVDDASTDTSVTLIETWLAKHPAINAQVRRHAHNQGTFAARATGIRAANNEVILFLDADDSLAATALSELQNHIEARQSDVVFFDLQYLDAQHHPVGQVSAFRAVPSRQQDALTLYRQINRLNRGIGGKLVRRAIAVAALDEIGELTRPLTRFEDQLFLLVATTLANTASYLNKPLYLYRHQPQQQRSAQAVADNYSQCVYALKVVEQTSHRLLGRQHVPTTKLRQLQQQQQRLLRLNRFAIRNCPLARETERLSYFSCVWQGCISFSDYRPWLALCGYLVSLSLLQR